MHSLAQVVPLYPSAQLHVQVPALTVPPLSQLRGQAETKGRKQAKQWDTVMYIIMHAIYVNGRELDL